MRNCVDMYEQYKNVAERVGCGGEFRAALTCAANGEGTDSGFSTDCDDEGKAFSDCEEKAGGAN